MPASVGSLRKAEEQVRALRAHVQGFVRRYGLLAEERTPCGQPLQLSHAHALLVLLQRAPGGATHQKHLATALALDKSSVARLCARLEEDGHVTQVRSEVDARAREIELTAKGLKLANQVEVASRSRFERLLAAIPANRRASVLDSLALLEAAAESLEASS